MGWNMRLRTAEGNGAAKPPGPSPAARLEHPFKRNRLNDKMVI
jgi:hypothetical protein